LDPILTPIYDDDDETCLVYTRIQTPIQQWVVDQYVGSERARELGLWKSDDDPNRTWTAQGTVTVYEDNLNDMSIVVDLDGFYLSIDSYRDQWGTYYFVSMEKDGPTQVIAQEDGTRSVLRSIRDALNVLIENTEFGMKDAEKRM